MHQRIHVPPIERDTLTYVGIRVAVRLIALDYHHHPSHYAESRPLGVLNLAQRMRLLFPQMWQPLVYVSKCVGQGVPLIEVRRLDIAYAPRALHKRLIR